MEHLLGNARKMSQHPWAQIISVLGVLLVLVVAVIAFPRPAVQAAHHRATSGDWPTYMADNARDGYNSAETVINPSTANSLKLHWALPAGGPVVTEPVEANGMIYWGSWDGVVHGTSVSTGRDVWTVPNLGNVAMCHITIPRGVTGTATVASVLIKGVTTSTVFVGGGNATLYAIDALKGTVLWHTSLGSSPNHFLYSSTLVYNGSVYVGMSAYDDCHFVQGQMIQVNASTGVVQHTFNIVPKGCLGGSAWGSPSLDTKAGLLYFSSGNPATCSTTETMTNAVIALNASDLSLASYWQIPSSQQTTDGDFGSTPTLFQATIKGVLHQMLGLVNKNGFYYALDRTNLSAGPLWQVQISAPGGPQASISSSAFDGTNLYVVGAITTIGGKSCGGSIRGLNPATGAFLWEFCFGKNVLAPVISVPGLAVVGVSHFMYAFNGTSGKRLFTYTDSTAGANFWGAASISNGVLYIGSMSGNLYAFGM